MTTHALLALGIALAGLVAACSSGTSSEMQPPAAPTSRTLSSAQPPGSATVPDATIR